MTGVISLTAAYFCVATLYFLLIQKPLFGMVNSVTAGERIKWSDIVKVYRHGIVSDFIIASYVTAIPVLTAMLRAEITGINLQVVMSVYNAVIALCIGLITIADTVLYRFWQYKLDTSALAYLRTPKEAFASVPAWQTAGGFLAAILAGAIFFAAAQWAVAVTLPIFPISTPQLWELISTPFVAILLLGILFVLIRGLKIRPYNPSIVYFSSIPFLNHWALNPAYNLIYSLTTRDEFRGKFRHFSDEECRSIVEPLFPTSGNTQRKLLRTDRPNVLLIIWESCGEEFVESLGGRKGVTPNLDRIAAEGVSFSRCTSTSFRTDRGLVGIISGYLGQPTTSVIRYTRKLPNLPAFPRRLKEQGYRTTAVHGGELSLMHISDYLLASGHDRLVSLPDLPHKRKDVPTGKWGVHDGWMFDMLLDDIKKETAAGGNWMMTFQTLSSHEPFDVPYNKLENPVDNSFAYVDEALGHFIDTLKETPAWDNLLVAIVADHGYNAPGAVVDRQRYAHIPLVFTGGAVKEPAIIDTPMSQTDLAATLLGQLGMRHDEFIFSRDVLADSYTYPFTFHSYINGFMYTDSTGMTDFDNVADAAVKGADAERERKGRAILQYLYDDISKR
ncbi:LTA synthase family protein [uncultured Duncaniella sp.]|uniref:LTA synthase family protein n=1 Tax=uncultured Duncaniella sp. TaxID=2768039 RepID=UPI00265984D5|nr:LTA synthase family protein [uncultured Duncaniella sp.]